MGAIITSRSTAAQLSAFTDPVSGALITVPLEHRQIHAGITYTVDAVEVNLAANGSIDLLVRLPATVNAYMVYRAYVDGQGQLFIYESPTTTNDGTAQTPMNHNRTLSTPESAQVSVFLTPTVSDVGTALLPGVWLGSKNAFVTFAPLRERDEFVLKAGRDYLYRLTNTGSGANDASLGLQWYELAA